MTRTVYFDATRLRARLRFSVPTGIDRVDLAYLQMLSADARIQLKLVVRHPLGVQVLKPAAARQLIDDIAQGWPQPSSTEQPRALALRRWLESSALTPRPALPAEPAVAIPRTSLAQRARQTLLSAPRTSATQPGLYINTSHGQLYQPAYARWLRNTGLGGLFFVHDLIPIEYPEYSRAAEPARHAARLATIAAHARTVLVNSQATRASLQAYWSARQVAMPNIVVAPLGISPDVSGPALPPITAAVPYFVMLGTIEPRKNHTLLLTLWRQMVEADPASAPRLALVGRRGWENDTVFNLLDRSPHLARHVIECAGLGDAELLALLRGARALLNPSFAEGFGLPVAEALAAGTPVLASALAAHQEVGGACADYFDPLDGLGWRQAIRDFASAPSPRRQQALQRLAAYQPPSWQDHFSIVRAQMGGLA